MRFSVTVGQTETNVVEYSFNQLLGTSLIKVNGQTVKRETHWFSEPLDQIHEVEVGARERWQVRIEKERKLLFGQRCRVFLNQQLAGLYEGV